MRISGWSLYVFSSDLLLSLYDRVDIILDRHQPLWLGRLGIGRPDLQELVSMGRLRLVLPFSAEKYLMPELLDAVSEADPDALILSRQLARARLRAARRITSSVRSPDRKSTRLNSSHQCESRMPSSA